jgi:hypothetical protein
MASAGEVRIGLANPRAEDDSWQRDCQQEHDLQLEPSQS